MKVLGIVAEYNPFHNGHLYHLEESKKLSGCDAVICVMSGNFVQRGEPAIINKWARTKIALNCGIDLAIELPFVYSAQSAEYFASGAVNLLDSLAIVDYISFGSELGRLDELRQVTELLLHEPVEYTEKLKFHLGKGLSFPSARERAVSDILTGSAGSVRLASALSKSNNILGIEYLKALKKINSGIKPITIGRIKADYNSEEITGTIASATAIRKNISGNCIAEPAAAALPPFSLRIMEEEFNSGRGPVYMKNLEGALLYQLRRTGKNQLAEYPDISEGLENRIKEHADGPVTLELLIDGIKTKRYTRTRIQRILTNLLIGLKSEELESFRNCGPQYIRVLGFSEKGMSLLNDIKKKASLPIITKPSDYRKDSNEMLVKMLEVETRATDIYTLCYSNPDFRTAGQDYTTRLVMKKNR